jgi:DNA-binding NtrC family response regulator
MASGGSLPQWSGADDAAELYARLFAAGDIDAIDRVVDTIRARRATFVRCWRHLYEERLGVHRECAIEVFQATYVPHLRSAVLRVAGGDVAGFMTFAALLGAQVADAGVPFGVMVAHLNLLRESCLRVLALEPGGVDAVLVSAVDWLAVCGVTAAADGYYRGPRRVPPPAGGNGSAADVEPRLRAPVPWTFENMVGRSEAMQRVFEHIRRLAAGNASVLIAGETGTGKELVARAIHNRSPRRTGPFVAVNCAALPRELVESEVFGYKRGAFSGALGEHLGLFRAAAGGTLLLDEVTEMSPDLQAKLLRVLQERAVRPLGAVAEVPVDVRIVATTNRDPETAVAAGALRADFYYRLSAAKIVVPPLRERRDDLLPLVEHHMAALNERSAQGPQGVRGVASDAMVALLRYHWPGNVRELFNVLEDAVRAARSLHVRVEDLGLSLAPESRPRLPAGGEVVTVREAERALIERALRASGGNKLLASRLLGISRKRLYTRIAQYALATADDGA